MLEQAVPFAPGEQYECMNVIHWQCKAGLANFYG